MLVDIWFRDGSSQEARESREAVTKRILDVAAGRNSASVYAKMRIADVLDVNKSGISDEMYSYSLKAHFDFVVADETEMPMFAVEYDGPTHLDEAAIKRDLMKNELCERLGLPLARVRDEHIFKQARGIDYLTWLAEAYFIHDALLRAQAAGDFPADEPPDPMLAFSIPSVPGRFPLFVSAPARISLRKLYAARHQTEAIPMVLCGDDRAGRSTALLLIQLADGSLVTSQASIYLRWFGIAPSEAAEEIAIVNLEALVRAHVEKARAGTAAREARQLMIEFLRNHDLPSFGISSTHAYGFNVSHSRNPDGERWIVGALGDEAEVRIDARRR